MNVKQCYNHAGVKIETHSQCLINEQNENDILTQVLKDVTNNHEILEEHIISNEHMQHAIHIKTMDEEGNEITAL